MQELIKDVLTLQACVSSAYLTSSLEYTIVSLYFLLLKKDAIKKVLKW